MNAGDEVDQYFGSLYGKDPDATFSPATEIKATRDAIREWSAAFPLMRIAISNHGLRWAKRAFEAGIPSEMIRPYQEIIGAPDGWKWRERWKVDSKVPWVVQHGMGYSGVNGHRNAALDNGISTVIGHLHANGGVSHVATACARFWAMNSGCLIDVEAYAFHYGKEARNKPTLGLGVVVDDGKNPIFIAY